MKYFLQFFKNKGKMKVSNYFITNFERENI